MLDTENRQLLWY